MRRLVGSAVVAALTLAALAPAHAAGSRSWSARLSGAAESPAVTSKISGSATVRLVADSSIHYRFTTSKMTDVTMAHLHGGAKGENGPIVVTLQTPELKGKQMVSQGVIHAADLSGPMAGRTLADFAASCDSGNVYVNVHTQAHPDGEVRGQLRKAGGAATPKKKTAATPK